MHVGVCRIHLRLPESSSLKFKRQVIRSITSRVKNRYDVAIAEVDDNDRWQFATLGIACISNDARHANEVLSKVVDFVQTRRFDAEVLDYDLEIIPL